MSSFEELVRECDRLWLNCRCTRLRLTPVKKQVQKDNRRKAVELKADCETFLQHAAENLEDAGWKTEMDRRVLALLRSESVLNFAVLKPAVQEEFLSITKQFVRDAMCFDTRLSWMISCRQCGMSGLFCCWNVCWSGSCAITRRSSPTVCCIRIPIIFWMTLLLTNNGKRRLTAG